MACLSARGRLLVFALAELKHQPAGGRGLMLMADIDADDPLASVATTAGGVRVSGVGRGQKARDEELRPAALAAYVNKRARKGRPLETTMKVQRVSAS